MRSDKRWMGGVLVGVIALAGGTGIAAKEGDAKAESSQLDGATVYAWNCGSCHSERWPKERTDAEWELIATHMRVRANLTAEQTDAVLRYLQGNN